jgi:hypothetical protein
MSYCVGRLIACNFDRIYLQYTRAVRKVSVHFEYLENRSRDLDVTWQPVRGPYCVSVNSHSPVGLVSRQWVVVDWAVCCVTVAFTMTEWADKLHRVNAPAHSTAFVQAFLAKHYIIQVIQSPYSPDLVPCDFWLFSQLNLPLKGRRFVNATVTQYTSSVNGVSLSND